MADKPRRDGVISSIRACLLSAKGLVPLRSLNSDYRMLVGENIPYRAIGYPSLEDFLTEVPGIKIAKKGGDWFVDVQPTESTAHIARMISQQRSATRSKPRRRSAFTPRASFQTARRAASVSQVYHRNSHVNNENQYYQSQRYRAGTSNLAMPSQKKKPTVMYEKPPPAMLPNFAVPQQSFGRQQQDRKPVSPLITPPQMPQVNQNNFQTTGAVPRMRSIESAIQPPMQHVNQNNIQTIGAVPRMRSIEPVIPPLMQPMNQNSLQPTSSAARMGSIASVIQPLVPQIQFNDPTLSVVARMRSIQSVIQPLMQQVNLNNIQSISAGIGMRSIEQPPQQVALVMNRNQGLLPDPVPLPMVGGMGASTYKPSPPRVPSKMCDRLKVKPVDITPPVVTPLTPPLTPTTPTTEAPATNEDRVLVASLQGLNPCARLIHLTRAINLPEPVYKLIPRTPKGQSTVYACLVKVGSSTYKTYPEEKPTTDEAKELAATELVKILLDEHFSGLRETRNQQLIVQRVTAIVKECQSDSGMMMHEVPIVYKQKFKENLPTNWLNIIKESSDITIVEGGGDSIILRTERISQKSSEPTEPTYLIPPIGERFWDVHITAVMNTVDIWARLIGDDYSTKYESMTADMEAHYGRSGRRISTLTTVEVGSHYAVLYDDCWFRVQCLEYKNTSETLVLFIDFGDEVRVPCNKLFILDKKFCRLPAQAMRLCLFGLEDFGDCDTVADQLEEVLLGCTLVAEVKSCGQDEYGPFANVILYDTYGPEDIDLNELLLRKIAAPKLSQAVIEEVVISHTSDNGDVYVRVMSWSLTYLTNLMDRFFHSALSAENVARSKVTAVERGKIYLASIEDGGRHRAVVSNVLPNNEVEMFLVDYGKTVILNINDLLLMENLCDALAIYPYQALKVRLHNVPESMFGQRMAVRLAELAPQNEPLLVKLVVSAEEGIPPSIEAFKRTQPNNQLVSINDSIALEPELMRSSGDGNNNTRSRKRVERTFSRPGLIGDGEPTLQPPKIPDVGNEFDVHITMAANPGNFTVQPYNDADSLNKMMTELQDVCQRYSGPLPLPNAIKKGRLYAAQHNDRKWYRVSISNIMSEEMVAVYFCDYGDASALTLDKLQPLDRRFLKLPYQAIRARLVGVHPANTDWSVEDSLRFQELVMERDFVSRVKEIDPDNMSVGLVILGLELIDTSNEADTSINELLVEEGRALKTEA